MLKQIKLKNRYIDIAGAHYLLNSKFITHKFIRKLNNSISTSRILKVNMCRSTLLDNISLNSFWCFR